MNYDLHNPQHVSFKKPDLNRIKSQSLRRQLFIHDKNSIIIDQQIDPSAKSVKVVKVERFPDLKLVQKETSAPKELFNIASHEYMILAKQKPITNFNYKINLQQDQELMSEQKQRRIRQRYPQYCEQYFSQFRKFNINDSPEQNFKKKKRNLFEDYDD